MRPMARAPSICATGGWSATRGMPICLPPARRYAHERTVLEVALGCGDAVCAAGERPGADSRTGFACQFCFECADEHPNAAAARHAPHLGAVWRLSVGYGGRAAALQLTAARSTDPRRQALYLAERRDLAGN